MFLEIAYAMLLQAADNVTPEGVRFDDRVETYSISGSTSRELRDQMYQRGPVDENTHAHYTGDTVWQIRWQYETRSDSSGCHMDHLQVTIFTVATVPEWTDERAGPADLRAAWTRFLSALTTHEWGHRNSGLRAAIQVHDAIQRLPSSPDCDALKNAVDAAAGPEVERAKRADIAYDGYTRHGETQGVVLP